MLDFEAFKQIGWTVLLGWALRETVATKVGQARLEAKLENGLSSAVAKLEKDMAEVKKSEGNILATVENNVRAVESRLVQWCNDNLRERRQHPRERRE